MKAVRMFNWRFLLLIAMLQFTHLWVLAQENSGGSSTTTTTTKKVDVDISTTDAWYTNPIVWVVGAAVFILLLVALLRGGGSSRSGDRVTVTRTVERDTDV